FEPQPELHPVGVHGGHQRPEAVWPDRLVDVPVPEAGAVVPAVTEPSIVEHITFHADGGCGLGKCNQPVYVMVEVDRLPHVQCHRARCARVLWAAPQELVEPASHLVQTPTGGPVDPRRSVGLTLCQSYLA